MFFAENLYKQVVDIIKNEISSVAFSTWFSSVVPEKIENDTLYLRVPIAYTRDMIQKKYKELLKTAVVTASQGEISDYEFLVEDRSNAPSVLDRFQSDFQEESSSLNKKYTFQNFVIGESNRFAHAAAIAVAESPAENYNPLFIYGGVGLGKTHLLHAIGNRIKENDPSKRVLYITSESFTNEFIDSIKAGKNNGFREKLRNIDVLMVDDIQFIGGKEGTQEEFFHTFNHLYHNDKQIVLSSDRPPKDIRTLEERLRTRFEAGLMCDINAPDLETRIAILKKKTEEENFPIEDEIIQFIASKIKSNVRELEGIFTRLVAMTKLSKKEITKELAEDVIKVIIADSKKVKPGIETVMVETAGYFNIDPQLLKSSSKKKEIVKARQVAMFLAREVLEMSLPKIGEEFGGRDHSTVMYSIEKINEIRKTDAYIDTIIEEITDLLVD
ncbi:MAG: chromosomal replication initiator protein DnaA [Clostridia bacterium]|nr:chromosomal replication initiator protein DnaA [Clostridia bacterium]